MVKVEEQLNMLLGVNVGDKLFLILVKNDTKIIIAKNIELQTGRCWR